MKGRHQEHEEEREAERGQAGSKKNRPSLLRHQGRNYTFTQLFSQAGGPHRSNCADVAANFLHEI